MSKIDIRPGTRLTANILITDKNTQGIRIVFQVPSRSKVKQFKSEESSKIQFHKWRLIILTFMWLITNKSRIGHVYSLMPGPFISYHNALFWIVILQLCENILWFIICKFFDFPRYSTNFKTRSVLFTTVIDSNSLIK